MRLNRQLRQALKVVDDRVMDDAYEVEQTKRETQKTISTMEGKLRALSSERNNLQTVVSMLTNKNDQLERTISELKSTIVSVPRQTGSFPEQHRFTDIESTDEIQTHVQLGVCRPSNEDAQIMVVAAENSVPVRPVRPPGPKNLGESALERHLRHQVQQLTEQLKCVEQENMALRGAISDMSKTSDCHMKAVSIGLLSQHCLNQMETAAVALRLDVEIFSKHTQTDGDADATIFSRGSISSPEKSGVESTNANAPTLRRSVSEKESSGVDCLSEIMKGGWLLKFTRKGAKHLRYVTVNPFKRTINWLGQTRSGEAPIMKSARIVQIAETRLLDNNPSVLLLATTADRKYTFQAQNEFDHALWLKGLLTIVDISKSKTTRDEVNRRIEDIFLQQ